MWKIVCTVALREAYKVLTDVIYSLVLFEMNYLILKYQTGNFFTMHAEMKREMKKSKTAMVNVPLIDLM